MEVNNYYPYGLLNSSLSYSRSGNRYKYQTKEVDNYFDYNILDFGARHYDPAAARWTVYDPASQYATPYIAMGGNPVSGIDPTGTVSHRLSDSQSAIAAACASIEYVTNGNQPLDYSMYSNVSSAGRGGGQTYYEIGLQTGSTAMAIYQDARGNFYANANSASNATGLNYNDIIGLSGGEKLYQYSNQDLGALDAKGRGAHLNIISQHITGSYNIDFDGLSFKQYTGDVTWKFGNVDEQGGERDWAETGFGINSAIDNSLTLTSGAFVGAQRLANSIAKTSYKVITEVPILHALGRLTGAISIVDNFMKFKQNPSENLWNGIEGTGQLGFWLLGGGEAELIFNLSTMTIDGSIGLYNYYNSPNQLKKK